MHHGTLVAVVVLLGDDIPAEQFAERADDDRCRSVFRSTPANGKPSGEAIDVLTGFITDSGDAMGRPVGVAIDRRGALLVADDVGNTVWRVTATGKLASGK